MSNYAAGEIQLPTIASLHSTLVSVNNQKESFSD